MPDVEAGAYHRRNFVTTGFESLTVDGTAGGKALTAATYGTSRYALITIYAANIVWTTGGTAPTSTVGHHFSPADRIWLDSHEDIVSFRAIREGATNAVINVTYQEIKLTA